MKMRSLGKVLMLSDLKIGQKFELCSNGLTGTLLALSPGSAYIALELGDGKVSKVHVARSSQVRKKK